MAEFDYNPFVESLHITFLCPHCNGANTEDIIVPTPDWLAESHHDSINSDTLDLQCAHCGNEIKIDLATGIYGGEGNMPKVKKIVEIKEEYPVDEDYYDGQLFQSTYNETINTLNKIEALDEATKVVLYKLLYANLITKMEAFLSDTLKQEVFATEESKRKFVENYADFKEHRMSLNEIYK